MPFKKNRKTNENTKEKKAIATRLMVISLKMDGYIYKNKPISAPDAQTYIEEIRTYKLKCLNDVRSLQVIEKLTLFMKSIIKQNTLNNNCNENSNIDIERYTHNRTFNTITHCENNNEKNTVKVCAVDNSAASADKNQDNAYIDVENNIEINPFPNLSIKPFKHNLSKDTNDQTKPYILDTINDELHKDISIPIQNESDVTIAVAGCNSNLKNSEITNTLNNIVLQNNTEHNNKQVIQNTTNTIENNKGENCVGPLKHIGEVSLVNDNNDTSMLHVINSKDKIASTNKVKKKTVRSKKEVKIKDTDNNKKRQSKQKVSKKTCKTVAKRNRNDNTGKKKSNCNRLVENNASSDTVLDKDIVDVSWIQNMKYVREVCKDEYDLTIKNLGDTFWDDLTLPVNWNFNDFDYAD